MLTNVYDMDVEILNHLPDEDLIQFCQTSSEAQKLCQHFNKRLNLYMEYKLYDYMLYLPARNLLLFKYNINNHRLSYTVYAITYSINIVKLKAADNEYKIHIDEMDYCDPYDIIKGTDWSADIATIYHSYLKFPCAKRHINNLLKNKLKLMSPYTDKVGIIKLFGLHFWFQANCLFLGLIDNSFEESRHSYMTKTRIMNEILLYYDLLNEWVLNN